MEKVKRNREGIKKLIPITKHMILVKNVEIMEVDEDIRTVFHFDPVRVGYEQALQQVHEEIVRGKRFRNADGRDVVIGMTKEVQNNIGLPFEAFETMEKTLTDCQAYNKKLEKKISEAAFWKRLKYLFVGRIECL